MKNFILFISFVGFSLNLNSQAIKNSYIVDLKKDASETFMMDQRLFTTSQITKTKVLSSTLDIVQVTLKKEGDVDFENWLDRNPNVESWGYNYYSTLR